MYFRHRKILDISTLDSTSGQNHLKKMLADFDFNGFHSCVM